MKKIITVFLFSMSLLSAAQAALPPYWERTREMEGILRNEAVSTAVRDVRFRGISSGMVDGIRYVGSDENGVVYQVISGKCTLKITLKSKPRSGPPMVGPWQYEISVDSEMVCSN